MPAPTLVTGAPCWIDLYSSVTDKAIVKRLEWRFAEFKALRSGGVRPVAKPPRLGRQPWQLPWRRSDPRS